MSGKVDERVLTLEFDNAEFAKGVQDTQKGLKTLTDTLDNAEGSAGKGFFDRVRSGISNLDFGGIQKGVEKTSVKMGLLDTVGFAAISKVTGGLMDMAKGFVGDIFAPIITGGKKRAQNIEQAKFQFKGLGMDIESTLKNANDAVTGTAYGLDEAAVLAAQFGATGMKSGQDMTDALRAVAGVAAMAGTSYSEMGNVFGKVAGQGRLMGDDLNRLAARGVNAAAIMAKQMGISEAEFRKMVSENKISFDMFADGMKKQFGDLAGAANQTYSGAVSQFMSVWSRVGANFFTPYYTAMRDVFNHTTNFLRKGEKIIAPLGGLFEQFFGKVSDGANKHLAPLEGYFDSLIGHGTGFFEGLKVPMDNFFAVIEAVVRAFGKVHDVMSPEAFDKAGRGFQAYMEKFRLGGKDVQDLERTFAGLFATLGIVGQAVGFVVKFFLNLVGAMLPVGSGLLSITGSFGDMMVALNKALKEGTLFGGALKKIGEVLLDVATIIGKVAGWILTKLGGALGVAFNLIGSLANALGKVLSPVLKPLGDGFTRLWNKVMEFANFIGRNFEPALKKVGDQAVKLGEFLGGKLGDAFKAVGKLGTKAWDAMLDSGKKLQDFLGPKLGETFKKVGEWGRSAWDTALASGQKFYDFMDRQLGPVFENIGNHAKSLADTISNRLGPVFSTIGDYASNAWDKVGAFSTNNLKPIGDWFANLFSGVDMSNVGLDFGSFGGFFKSLYDSTKEVGGNFANNLGDQLGLAWEWISTDGFEGGKKVVGGIADGVSSAASTIWDGLTTQGIGVWDSLGAGVDVFITKLNDTFGGALDGVIKFKNEFSDSSFGQGLASAGETVAGAWDKVVEVFEKVKTYVTELIGGSEKIEADVEVEVNPDKTEKNIQAGMGTITDKIKEAADGIKTQWDKHFGKVTFDQWLDVGGLAVGGYGIFKLGGLIDSIKKQISGKDSILTSAKTTVDALGGVFTSFSGVLEETKKNVKADSILKIAGAVALLGATVVVFGKMEAEEVTQGIIAMTMVVATLKNLMKSVEGMTKDMSAKDILAASVLVGVISASLFAMSISLKKLGDLEAADILQGVLAITVIMSGMSKAVKNMPRDTAGFANAAALMLGMSASMLIMSEAIEKLGDLDPDEMVQGILGVTTVLIGLTVAAKALDGVQISLKSVAAIAIFSIVVGALSTLAVLMGKVDFEDLGQGILGMTSVLTAITMAAVILDGVKVDMRSMASLAALTAIIGALAGISYIIGKSDFDEMGPGMLAVTAFAVGLAGLAKALSMIKFTPKDAAAILAMTVSVGILAGMAVVLGEIDGESALKGATAMAAAMAALAVASRLVGKNAGSAATLIGLSVGVLALAPALKMIADIPAGDLAKATAAISTLLLVLGGASRLSKGITTLSISLGGFSIAVGRIVSPIALLVGSIALLSAAVAAFLWVVSEDGPAVIQFFEDLANKSEFFTKKAGDAFRVFLDEVEKSAPKMKTSFDAVLGAFLGVIDDNIGPILNTLKNMITSMLNMLKDNAYDWAGAGAKIIEEFIRGIADNIDGVVEAGADLAINFMRGLEEELPELADAAVDLVATAIVEIGNAIEAKSDELEAAGEELGQKFFDGLLGFTPGEDVNFAKWLLGDEQELPREDPSKPIGKFNWWTGRYENEKETPDMGAQFIDDMVEEFERRTGITTESIWKTVARMGTGGASDVFFWLYDAFNNVRDWLENDYGPWIQDKKEEIGEAWDNFFEGVKDLPGKISSWFDEVKQKLKEKIDEWLQPFREKKEELGKAVEDFFSKVREGWGKIGEWFQEGYDKISEWLDFYIFRPFREKKEQLGQAVDDFFSNLGKGWDTIVGWFQEGYNKIVSWIDTYILTPFREKKEQLGQAVDDFFSNLGKGWDTIVGWFQEGYNKIVSWIDTYILTPFREKKADLEARATEFANGVRKIPETIGQWISSAAQKAAEIAQAPINKIREFFGSIGSAATEFGDKVKAIPDKIGSWIGSARTKASEIAQAPITAIRSKIGSIGSAATEFGNKVKAIPDKIRSWVGSARSRASEIATSAINGISSRVGSFSSAATRFGNAVKAAPDKIRSWFGSAGSAASGLGQRVVSGLSGMVGSARNAASRLGSSVQSTADGIRSRLGAIGSAASSVGSRVVSGLRNSAGSAISAARSIGSNIISGMIGGITGAAGRLAGAAANAARSALAGAKRALAIKSPSRKFMEVGKYAMAGFRVGIENNVVGLTKAAYNSGTSVLDSVRDAMRGPIGVGAFGEMYNPVIKPVVDLENVHASANDILGILGGSPTLSGNVGAVTSQFGAQSAPAGASNVTSDAAPTGVVFNQYNNSPKALTTPEIYRQTNNQLSVLKGIYPKR